ncbi:hypothetical protein [Segetibacter koreensis]|uniref:hypothetical protein n=1 Tax=Segetibacter koreensis TaxID=398037 RepID=UPI00036AE986|nr:hypothetical protein [Segetibacter koreensis]
MNNNYNIIRKIRERVLKNFYPVYHAPLVFDIGTQTTYRKAGYVAWPENHSSKFNQHKEEEKQESKLGNRGYFAYPKNKFSA